MRGACPGAGQRSAVALHRPPETRHLPDLYPPRSTPRSPEPPVPTGLRGSSALLSHALPAQRVHDHPAQTTCARETSVDMRCTGGASSEPRLRVITSVRKTRPVRYGCRGLRRAVELSRVKRRRPSDRCGRVVICPGFLASRNPRLADRGSRDVRQGRSQSDVRTGGCSGCSGGVDGVVQEGVAEDVEELSARAEAHGAVDQECAFEF